MEEITKKHAAKIRFGIVGGANTAIDFGILITLRALGLPTAIANYPSSTIAVIFSFFANKHYTFKKSGSDPKREVALFLFFTLLGVWVIQPITIIGVEFILAPISFDNISLAIVSKLIATIATLIWNYLTYSKYVFSNKIK
jgi:putative flippase GtrA